MYLCSWKAMKRKVQGKLKIIVLIILSIIMLRCTSTRDSRSDQYDFIESLEAALAESDGNLGSDVIELEDGVPRSPDELVFFIILCNVTRGEVQSTQGVQSGAADVDRQIRQLSVLMKSALALSSSLLRFIIIANNEGLYSRVRLLPKDWDPYYLKRLRLQYSPVWYPEDRLWMKTMFRVCATERLFVPALFPYLDAAIYIDTDFIFLRPPEHLWNAFNKFSSVHFAAMAPNQYHYGTKRNKVPFYGFSGLNAGVMLMNFTRMNRLPTDFIDEILFIYDNYKASIVLADQDMLNIYFSKHPVYLYELDCTWNYRAFQCASGKNTCEEAGWEGVALLHGNALVFSDGHEMIIQSIFESWSEYSIGDSLPFLLEKIHKNLDYVEKTNQPSKCGRLKNIRFILLHGFEMTISSLVRETH